jgi:hypothetical protein
LCQAFGLTDRFVLSYNLIERSTIHLVRRLT